MTDSIRYSVWKLSSGSCHTNVELDCRGQLCCVSLLPPMPQGGFDWGDFVDGVTSGGAKQRKQDTGEPFYGFTDFLRDLDVDLKRWSDQVDKKGMTPSLAMVCHALDSVQHFLQRAWRQYLTHHPHTTAS